MQKVRALQYGFFHFEKPGIREWEGERVSNRDREGEQAREGGREGGMSCTGLQPVCVWETGTAATLQGTELQLNLKRQTKVSTQGLWIQHLLQVRDANFWNIIL